MTGCRTVTQQTADIVPLLERPLVAAEDTLLPSNQRNWAADMAVLPYAEFEGPLVHIRNVRNFIYQSDQDYVINYYDKTVNLDDLESVDFLVVPFKGFPSLAHTMLSFGFRDGYHLVVSVEARLEEGEHYSPLLGSLQQFELMYVLGDERDLIVRRTKHRDVDVYLYETVATPEQARQLFVDVIERVNKLYRQPEFYNTLTNNCTTNPAAHVNRLWPGKLPLELGLILPGFSDQLLYQQGLLKSYGSFAETRRRARITARANQYASRPDFSTAIRR